MTPEEDSVVRALLSASIPIDDVAALFARVLHAYGPSRRDDILRLLFAQMEDAEAAPLVSPTAFGPSPRARSIVWAALREVFPQRPTIPWDAVTSAGADFRSERQRRRGQLIALYVDDTLQCPAFQFRLRGGQLPLRPTVAQANVVLRANGDPWGALSWWVSTNGRLEGRAPVELIDTDEEQNLKPLAEAVVEPIG